MNTRSFPLAVFELEKRDQRANISSGGSVVQGAQIEWGGAGTCTTLYSRIQQIGCLMVMVASNGLSTHFSEIWSRK